MSNLADSASRSLDKSIVIKNHNTIHNISTNSNNNNNNHNNSNENINKKSHSPLTIVPMDTSSNSTKDSSVSPYTLSKSKITASSSLTNNGVSNSKIKTEISPYEVDDEEDDELNQKYSPPFLSELKLEEYQNIKNETHHNNTADKAKNATVISKILTTSMGKKRPLNTSEANIATDFSSSVKSSSNNKINKLDDLNDQHQQQNFAKKRFKQVADTAYSPTPTNLINQQQKNNENLEVLIVNTTSQKRPSSTVSNGSSSVSSISPQTAPAKIGASTAPSKTNTLKKVKSKTFKTVENDLKSVQQQEQQQLPVPPLVNTNVKVKLEADIRPKEEANGTKVVSDISTLRFKKLKNTKNPSTNSLNTKTTEATLNQTNELKNESLQQQTQLNANSSPLQASTLMTPPPSLSHSNSSAASSSASSYNNYSGSRSVSPTTNTKTTTNVVNSMSKIMDTVVGSLAAVEQQQKQQDVDNINKNIKKNELNQFEK